MCGAGGPRQVRSDSGPTMSGGSKEGLDGGKDPFVQSACPAPHPSSGNREARRGWGSRSAMRLPPRQREGPWTDRQREHG